MKITWIAVLLVIWTLIVEGFGALPEVPADPEAAHRWMVKRSETIQSLSSSPLDQQISELGEMLRQLKTLHYRDCRERDQIVATLETSLLSIPGHAEYYRDKINGTRSLMEAKMNDTDSGFYVKYRAELDNVVTYEFQTMQQLPSVETVGVLGEFLFDERGYVRKSTQVGEAAMYDKVKHSPVLLLAGEALDHLPIVGKPPKTQRFYNTPEDLEGWRTWYRQVKEGKRTFRFEGDPTEYDLNGPAPKEKLARIALDRKRDEERQMRQHTTKSKPESQAKTTSEIVSKPGNVAAILSSLLVLVSLVWHGLRKRRT